MKLYFSALSEPPSLVADRFCDPLQVPYFQVRNMLICCKRTIARCLLSGMWLMLLAAGTCGQDVPRLNAARVRFDHELDRLASICDKLELDEAAQVTRSWLPHARRDQLALFLPNDISGVDLKNDVTRHWLTSFNEARRKYASALFEAAVELVKEDESAAYRLLWHVLREDPDHAPTRLLLGSLASQVSATPRIRSGTAVLADLKWKPRSYLTVRTPHFEVVSRGSRDQTAKLAQNLEKFFILWTQVFYSTWAPEGKLAGRMAKQSNVRVTWPQRERFHVAFLADRGEYLKLLGASEDAIDASVGYYSPQGRRVILYAGDDFGVTLNHELTHQFFAEATGVSSGESVGAEHSYWLVEGIAMYMESLTDRGPYWTVGGWEVPRQQTSRYRGVRDGFWVSKDRLAASSLGVWKNDPQVALLYTHASGVTHALMSGRVSERSRERTIATVSQIYSSNGNTAKLLDSFGATEEAAKLAYQDAVIVDDEDVQNLAASGLQVEDLVLCGSELNAKSWQSLARQSTLRWLDVSFSNIGTDSLSNWLAGSQSLERLSLEGTAVDGGILRQIASLKGLRELDLSDCEVDDQQLSVLKGHPRLETLWLTHTQVTDATLNTLRSMPKLKTVEATGSRANAANWRSYSPR